MSVRGLSATEVGPIVGGQQTLTNSAYEVSSPYDDSLVAKVHRATPEDVERAIAGAVESVEEVRRMPSWRREQILVRISEQITAQRQTLAETIAAEAGKPVSVAGVEVDRAAFTFRVAAEEAKRVYGEVVPLDWLPGSEGRTALVRRVPIGPIAGIAPFNFPLNLVAHKVAPALAAGNPMLLRPASQTPLSALRLGQIVLEAGWPEAGLAVLPSSTESAAPLVEDDRIKLLTFTGSPAVGWALKARSGRKPVTLELGGNAAVIVHADADPEAAAGRVAWGAFTNAGQTCISVQRVYVHDHLYERFVGDLVARAENLKLGDPLDPATELGPLIDVEALGRVEAWVNEAVGSGATVLTGGSADGRVWRPTVLADVSEDMRVCREEVFGPVVAVQRYADVSAAIGAAGASDFGLQAGLFTHDTRVVDEAFERIEVGGLIVNDVPTYRIDHMPYGGVRQSGLGREGLRYAIAEMTELKLLVQSSSYAGAS